MFVLDPRVQRFTDATGAEGFLVCQRFPTAASAQCARLLLDQVNPAAFAPVPSGNIPPAEAESAADVPERDDAQTATVVAHPATLVVDEDAIPGCPSGVCGLD